MVNFKQIAEDCLSGKLSGTFVLRNTDKVKSSDIIRKSSLTCSYWSRLYGFFSDNGHCYDGCKHWSEFDVITFIPDMKKEQITIDIPEGMTVIREETPSEIKIKFIKKPVDYYTVVLAQKDKHQFIHVTEMNEISKSFNKKAEVLSKLTNIRNYFGKPEKYDRGYCIKYSKHQDCLYVGNVNTIGDWMYDVLFTEKEHAKQAIKMLGDELKCLFEPW